MSSMRLPEVDPVVDVVHRADGVGHGPLRVRIDGLQRGAHRLLEVAQVVHRIEDAEHPDAVERRALDELVHHVIRIVAVAEQVLAAQQHLLRRVGHGPLEPRSRSQGSSPR
jgi:hypothetical protein